MHAIGVRFLDEEGTIREGELVNPFRIEDDEIVAEFIGNNEVDVMTVRSNGEDHIFRTHISRVVVMFPALGLPLLPIKRDLSIFDQDAV